MRLFLIRHGIAHDRDPERWPDDALRPLTEEGLRRLERMAHGIRLLGLEAEAVVSSPLERARQTAEVVRGAFGVREPVRYSAGLAPGGSPARLWADVDVAAGRAGTVVLVGHEPDLSALLGELVGAPGARFEFRKGGLAEVLLDDLPPRATGVLQAFVPPRWLREIAR